VKWLERIKSRKLFVFITILVIGVIFQALGNFSSEFGYFLVGLGGLYGVSNAVSKFGSKGD
jgi:hypothetical protein